MPNEDVSSIINLPGGDPDPLGKMRKRVAVCVSFGLMFVTIVIIQYLFGVLNWEIFPKSPTRLDYFRAAAFWAAALNLFPWMYFPLEDYRVARDWLRTKSVLFPYGTSELFSLLPAEFALLLLLVLSLNGAFFFSFAGLGVFTVNLLGFIKIRNVVMRAMAESRELYSREAPGRRELLAQALDVIEVHWSSKPSLHWLFNRQQIRHLLLVLSFFFATILGLLAIAFNVDKLAMLSYSLGIAALFIGEVTITFWRIRRDKQLHEILERVRRFDARRLNERTSQLVQPGVMATATANAAEQIAPDGPAETPWHE